MIAGLCSVTFRSLAPAEVAKIAARSGLSAIEWAGDAHAPPGDAAAAARCREAARESGLSFVSYGSYFAAGRGESADAFVETARALGAQHLRVWAGQRGLGSTDATAALQADCARDLGAIGRLAARAEIRTSVEYHPMTLSDTPAAARRLLDAADCPTLASLWQPEYGLDDPGVAREQIAALGPLLSHLHVFTWTAAKQRRPLAAGEALWRAVLDAARALPMAGPRIAFLEFTRGDDPAALAEDAAALRRWLG